MDIGLYILIFILGFGTSFLSSIVSGTLAIFSIASFMYLGLSPHMALGTMRVGAFGYMLGGLRQLVKAKKIAWKLVVPYTIIGVVGAVIGVQIVIAIDEELLARILGFVILIFIPISILKPTLGIESRLVSARERLYGYLSYFLIAIWGGSITIGTGILTHFSQMHYFGLTILELKGTLRIPSLVKNVFTLSLFAYSGLVHWEFGLVFAAGAFFGGMLGVRYALKLGDVWLRRILIASIVLLALKLVLGY